MIVLTCLDWNDATAALAMRHNDHKSQRDATHVVEIERGHAGAWWWLHDPNRFPGHILLDALNETAFNAFASESMTVVRREDRADAVIVLPFDASAAWQIVTARAALCHALAAAKTGTTPGRAIWIAPCLTGDGFLPGDLYAHPTHPIVPAGTRRTVIPPGRAADFKRDLAALGRLDPNQPASVSWATPFFRHVVDVVRMATLSYDRGAGLTSVDQTLDQPSPLIDNEWLVLCRAWTELRRTFMDDAIKSLGDAVKNVTPSRT